MEVKEIVFIAAMFFDFPGYRVDLISWCRFGYVIFDYYI